LDTQFDDSNFVTVDGVLIKQDFDHLILEESEVDKYTPLQTATLHQTLFVPYPHDIQVLTYFLYSYYASVDVQFPPENVEKSSISGESNKFDLMFVVEETIRVKYFRKGELLQV